MINLVDIIIILFVLIFGIIGFKKGIIKEGVSFIGTLLVFIISYSFKGVIGNVLCKYMPFFFFGENFDSLVSINILAYQLIGFLILFGILMSAYHILLFVSKIFQKFINSTIILTIPSSIGGAVIGLIKGYLIAFIALLVLMLPLKDNNMYNESKLKDLILYETPVISKETKDISLSISEIVNLVDKIQNNTISKNDADLQIIDTMLKYKVIDRHTLEQLIVLDKLKGIDNIESILK